MLPCNEDAHLHCWHARVTQAKDMTCVFVPSAITQLVQRQWAVVDIALV